MLLLQSNSSKRVLITQNRFPRSCLYRVAQKLASFFVRLKFTKYYRFSKFFRCQNREKICNNTITKDPTTPQLCRYTTLCPAPRRGVLRSRPAFPLRKFFKESLTHGPLNLCVNEKTVRVNDSPYFQFWSHCTPSNRNIMQIVLVLTQKCWFVIPF